MKLTECEPTSFNGAIHLIIGPMFSGKTSEMFRRIKRYAIARKKCILIKYSKDDRYAGDAEASTHDRVKYPSVPCSGRLGDLDESLLENVDVIGIDEGQFQEDVVEFSEKWSNRGKIVTIAALDGTFERKSFGTICNLIPKAESVVKLNAICKMCTKDAAFSMRLSNELSVEVIGGEDKYTAVCRGCFLKYSGLSRETSLSVKLSAMGKENLAANRKRAQSSTAEKEEGCKEATPAPFKKRRLPTMGKFSTPRHII